MRTLKQLGDDEESAYPLGAAALKRDVYMDDVLTGAASPEEAKEIRRQLAQLCSAGGFPLKKWSANDATLLEDILQADRMPSSTLSWLSPESHSTLGLQWHPLRDHFTFSFSDVSDAVPTKRSVLSQAARMFDPLGWLAPVVVKAKIFIQTTWLQGLEWNDPLTEADTKVWMAYQSELPLLRQIQVSRWMRCSSAHDELELHGFADASERAYAAVIYLCVHTTDGRASSLIMAKTRVAPLKQVSLPRLELAGATLLARLVAHVQLTLGWLDVPVFLWSDSTVALGWIQGHPSRWTTYVANRVAEIQRTVPETRWGHVPGPDNPADCASRGVLPSELVEHALWWSGPAWLTGGRTSWPTSALPTNRELPETRIRSHHVELDPEEPSLITRSSNLNRLVRVIAWCRRWLRTGRPTPEAREAVLDVDEMSQARQSLIKLTQATWWKRQLSLIRGGKPLPRGDVLTRLSPFLDDHDVLRVGGRLKHSLLSYDERHPVILPRKAHLTQLVIEACHRTTLHSGTQATLGLIRQHYWIPGGRAAVKGVIRRCLPCVRWRAATPTQRMGDLPRPRVVPSRPFLHTGVDYAGPVMLRTSRGRGHKAYKAFVAVFVCFSPRAVHLKVVSDYTSETFLAALKRFTSRRGLCHSLYSDCGTNFIGADRQLRDLFAASSQEGRRVADHLGAQGIRWRFNPPAAPHFGGLWEAAVKAMKHHLRRVLGNATLIYEEMATLLAQVEACLNSRPLQALTDDPEDFAVLTPGHFLVGSAFHAVPEPSLRDEPANRLGRWLLVQQMRDRLWERWSREYLHALNHRPKWWDTNSDVRVGRLCLLRNEITAPTRWPLARIVSVHPGEDGRTRVVTVRTSASELTRPVAKLVILPAAASDNCQDVPAGDRL